jgi:transcriptional regulator with XRE-family HTH domain
MGDDQASDAPMAEVASKIHETRVSFGWTQNELAERAGVSRPTVARIERGDDISTATLEKIVLALELRIELT